MLTFQVEGILGQSRSSPGGWGPSLRFPVSEVGFQVRIGTSRLGKGRYTRRSRRTASQHHGCIPWRYSGTSSLHDRDSKHRRFPEAD